MSVVYLDFSPISPLKRQASKLKRLSLNDLTLRLEKQLESSRDTESEFIDKTVLFKCFTLKLDCFKTNGNIAGRNLNSTNF